MTTIPLMAIKTLAAPSADEMLDALEKSGVPRAKVIEAAERNGIDVGRLAARIIDTILARSDDRP